MRLLSFAPPEKPSAAVVLKNGQNISLYVRSVNSDGTARIQVAGADITARSEMPAGFSLQPGSILKGNVFFEGGRVYIKVTELPFPRAFSFSSFLASNGISPSEAAVHALSFFYISGMRMDISAIRKALSLAAAFPGKEFRAAEAAALLLQKGLPLTESNLKAAMDTLEGKVFAGDSSRAEEGISPFNPDAKDQNRSSGRDENESGHGQGGSKKSKAEAPDFFGAFAGGGTGEGAEAGRAWFILPFKRRFGESECAGSIRFLMDKQAGKALETRVTAVSLSLQEENSFSADFVLSESGCRFSVFPAPSERAAGKLVAELGKMLKSGGIAGLVKYGFGENFPQAKSVDIEI